MPRSPVLVALVLGPIVGGCQCGGAPAGAPQAIRLPMKDIYNELNDDGYADLIANSQYSFLGIGNGTLPTSPLPAIQIGLNDECFVGTG